MLSRAEAELIGYADLVTTVNQSIAQEMPKRYRIERPAVILNAPAAPRKSLPLPRTRLIRDRLGLAASQRILLFQGRLSRNRNLEMLVRAMTLVRRPEMVLVFLGPDGGKRDELQEIARELGLLGNRIHFLDPVSQDELLSWTAGADVGIIPYPPIDLNSRLCTPNKLFEFIVAEVPILANDLPELRRFVVENGFGIARSMHNPPAIAAAIDEMMSIDPSAWWAALRARSAEFVWDRQGEEVVRLYRRLIAVTPTRLSAVILPEPRTICILALSPIADDPRVRRQAEAFHRAGWKVVAVGLPGATSPPPKWPILTHNSPAAAQTPPLALRLLRRRLRGLQYRLRRAAVSVRPTLGAQELLEFAEHPRHVSMRSGSERRRLARQRLEYAADCGAARAGEGRHLRLRHARIRDRGICRKPEVAAVAAAYGQRDRARVHPRRRRRLGGFFRNSRAPRQALSAAASDRSPSVIRRTFEEMPFRADAARQDPGTLSRYRGAEPRASRRRSTVSPLWRPEFTLTIRGPENPAFSPALRERIAALGLAGSRPAGAAGADDGTGARGRARSTSASLLLPGHSRHNEFALPNKFFEYVMAGLALCTTDLPEMARLIREYDLGVTIAAVEPTAIAAAINALDPDRIDCFKRNALTRCARTMLGARIGASGRSLRRGARLTFERDAK